MSRPLSCRRRNPRNPPQDGIGGQRNRRPLGEGTHRVDTPYTGRERDGEEGSVEAVARLIGGPVDVLDVMSSVTMSGSVGWTPIRSSPDGGSGVTPGIGEGTVPSRDHRPSLEVEVLEDLAD